MSGATGSSGDLVLSDAERLEAQADDPRHRLRRGPGRFSAASSVRSPTQPDDSSASARQGGCPGDHFAEVHRCTLEEWPLAAGSIDLAYAVMVLEHLSRPQPFWDKLFDVLADGGIFWGLTVDARHGLLSPVALGGSPQRIKDLYLDCVLGRVSKTGALTRNYPTYYRTNSPAQIGRFTRAFRSSEFINFSRTGQWGPYLPKSLTMGCGRDRAEEPGISEGVAGRWRRFASSNDSSEPRGI